MIPIYFKHRNPTLKKSPQYPAYVRHCSKNHTLELHTNICNSTKTSFTILIPPYKHIPLSLIVDHDLNILPPSELDHRIPLTDWEAIKPLTIFMATSNLRHKINKSSPTGNFEPFYPPELQITNPNLKGCKLFFN